MERIHYCDAMKQCFLVSDLEYPVEITIAIGVAEVLFIERQFLFLSVMSRLKHHFQPKERTVPELKVWIGEYGESTLSNFRFALEGPDEHAAI